MACSYCERDIKIVARGLCSACYTRQTRGSLERVHTSNKGKTCKDKGCSQPAIAKGFCMTHYERNAQHPLKTIWKLIRSRSKAGCKSRRGYPAEWDDFDVFLRDVGERPDTRHKLRRLDPDLPYSKNNVAWLPQLPGGGRSETTKAWTLRRYYKISVEEYDAMLAAQGGVCAICRNPETALNSATQKPRALAVDHDHKTGRVRGLLHLGCNQGLGLFNDDPALLRAAIAYLESHAALADQPQT